jgi:hypothetical protein
LRLEAPPEEMVCWGLETQRENGLAKPLLDFLAVVREEPTGWRTQKERDMMLVVTVLSVWGC